MFNKKIEQEGINAKFVQLPSYLLLLPAGILVTSQNRYIQPVQFLTLDEVIAMDIFHYGNVILMGFSVWLIMAPRIGNPRYGELFLAYMTALLFSLIGSSEIMMIKPTAFFFTIGGVLAFFYVVFRSLVKISVKK